MTHKQLIQKLEQTSDEGVETGLDSPPPVKAISEHPFAKFIGILSNSEATEIQRAITADCSQIDRTEW
ncbi:hypothetical protein NG799_11820 [Laspinema sp. D1]|uniref:Uncharacterized protein n=1 Tax=Laspinema palackyanum D2a TaxID=2953684 RepID=A0ABT2MQK6_9CYAN|nr:hypothetical protein [Laspinema sp. D2b]MCT7967024.1 hypothetical protein [Laspinema sp. D2a]